MAHQSLVPDDHGPYFEGDALDIVLRVEDTNTDPIDLTGATVEFRVKENRTDSDEEALLDKSSEEVGEVTLTDEPGGKATIHVDTGDTDGFLTDGSDRLDERTLYWHARVTDDEGRRVTTVDGDWTVTAS